MKSNIFIKYQTKDSGGFDLTTIGESFIGMDSNLKDFFELSGIDGELLVKTEKISEGSVLTHQVIHLATSMPFHDIRELLDFLYVVGAAEYKIGSDFFQAFGSGYKTVNDFFKENPLILASIELFLGYYFTKLMDAASSQKNGPKSDNSNRNIPMRYANGLHRMILEGKFRRTLKPIVEGSASEIIIGNNLELKDSSQINSANFENYLPEEEKILPELGNGTTHTFLGELLAIQSTKGEVLKFRIHNIDERFNLFTAYPADGMNTENYIQYYKKAVNITAQVIRDSLYKKPELQILSIELTQRDMFEGK
ncbi:MAG TPA: hypothetical protein VMR81_02285 [Patescibacteria group bacterium]|nr:hypothetical protein [Patescibacteria group bacterium]